MIVCKKILLLVCIPFFMILTFGCRNQVNQLKKPEKKPNIVLFIADDLGYEDIGPSGNTFVRTPNLDAFSKESTRFSNAFAGSPTCGPSRSSLFTGLYPFRHGGHGNHSAVNAGTRSIAHYYQQLGYQVAIAGKLHVGPEVSFPFERVSGSNIAEPGYEDKIWLHYDLNTSAVSKWLVAQNSAKPFVLIVADHSPHVIWPEKASYDPNSINIPSRHIDTKDTRKSRARYYTDITKMDSNFGKVLDDLKTSGKSENTMVIFTADQGPQWAFGKWTLYDYGIQTPLLVRWPGMIAADKESTALVSQTDILPTILQVSGSKSLPSMDGKSFMDVLLNGKKDHHEYVYATHTGDNQMNRSPARMVRTNRYKYILNLAPEIEFNTHMNKATDHDGGREYWPSWIEKAKTDKNAAAILKRYHNHPAEELYDVLADPDEKINLADDLRYRKILIKLSTQLQKWRISQEDTETGPEKSDPNPKKKGEVPYLFMN